MFSGIIESIATVQSIHRIGEADADIQLALKFTDFPLSEVSLGDSIAINGVCLTVVRQTDDNLEFDVSNETICCTSLASLVEGSKVNIERALMLSDRLNGHLVSGHVDTVCSVQQIYEDSRSWRFQFSLPSEYKHYISQKGSIAIDGVSLTVNEVNNDTFAVNIVPHTMQHTVFADYTVGQQVNIEIDMIARYLETLLAERD